MATPQVHLIGKIVGAKNFDFTTIYVKFNFVSGESWKLIGGTTSGDTFQSEGFVESIIPFEHPFDLNYAASTIRGWPKLNVEVWGIDSDGRNSIAGYGIIGIPMQSGDFSLTIPCWRPSPQFSDKMIGSFPELVYKDVLISSDSRFAFKTETTGQIIVDVSVLTKDFNIHGVQLNPNEQKDEE